MTCCRSAPCEQVFDGKMARRSLDRYRSKGLGELDRRVLASASSGGVEGAEVLEIGGGIGVIQAELIAAGAASGRVVDLVPSWEPYAAELAREKEIADRTAFEIADLLGEPDAVGPADVVVLNRVVCCSPDGIELTRSAAELARRTLVLSFPRGVPWLRAGAWVVNASFRLRRRSFRVYLHSRAALVGAAEDAGLVLADAGRTRVWEYVAFRRAT